MRLITYNEFLTYLCDEFDTLIAPRKIARNNANIIYLIFKGMSKGCEVINNVCVALSNKFNPELCSEEDLDSIATMVGTERLKGASTGLLINCTNLNVVPTVLPPGNYVYNLDENTTFLFENPMELSIEASSTVQFTALSLSLGSYPVTAQSEIEVKAFDGGSTPSGLSFGCADNSELLGYLDETDEEFRRRIVSDTSRQNVINELQLKLKNLPYVYDCNIVFNRANEEASYDGYTIPPYYMLIFVSGLIKPEMAEIIAKEGIYPTLETEDSEEVDFYNEVFADGKYPVYIHQFKKTNYSVKILYKCDTNYIMEETAEREMKTGLINAVNGNRHVDTITVQELNSVVDKLGIKGVKVLGMYMYAEGSNVPVQYITFPKSRISFLSNVECEAIQ